MRRPVPDPGSSAAAEAMNQQGLEAAARGALAEAEQLFRNAQRLGSEWAPVNLGTVYLEQRRWAEAEALLRPAADRHMAYAVFQLAVLHHATGRDVEALFTRFTAAADVAAVKELARFCLDTGNMALAERFYRLAADHDDVDAMVSLASVLHAKGHDTQSEHWYQKAVDRGHPIAMNNYGNLLRQRGRVADAVAMYRRAVAAGNDGALFNLGVALEDQGDPAGAEQAYRRALDTGDLDVLTNLGRLLRHRGEVREAERLYRRAIDAGYPNALHNLAILLEAEGRPAEARALRRQAAEAGTLDPGRLAATQPGWPHTQDVTADQQTVDPETFRPR
ncbi:tetratricopeptide repeat protein [Actinoplanes sp. NPDC051494]|uniref:tetratricopeptide repeat protein n=1 Tax=Actinoplanes sp. NPDC051494 TaxID=3363907 RepID=UPI0037A24604